MIGTIREKALKIKTVSKQSTANFFSNATRSDFPGELEEGNQ